MSNEQPAGREQMITDEEAKIYDRQIRLWGVEAQNLISAAEILVVGMNGLASEITKNLVLAGIHSITLMDDKLVTPEDAYANVFTRHQNGMNRAKAAKAGVQELNPRVKVIVDDRSIAAVLADSADKRLKFLKQFQMVVFLNQDLKITLAVNELCHANNVPFITALSSGFYSFVFTDIDPPNTISFSTAMENKTFYLDTTKTVPTDRLRVRRLVELRSFFVLVLTLYNYFDRNGHFPEGLVASPELQSELAELETEILDGLSNGREPSHGIEQWGRWEGGNWYRQASGSHTFNSSIVGGFLAQDIIRVVMDQILPLNAQLYSGSRVEQFNFGV